MALVAAQFDAAVILVGRLECSDRLGIVSHSLGSDLGRCQYSLPEQLGVKQI